MLRRFLNDECGATAVEYGLIIAVLSMSIVGGLGMLMNAIGNNFDSTTGIIENSINK